MIKTLLFASAAIVAAVSATTRLREHPELFCGGCRSWEYCGLAPQSSGGPRRSPYHCLRRPRDNWDTGFGGCPEPCAPGSSCKPIGRSNRYECQVDEMPRCRGGCAEDEVCEFLSRENTMWPRTRRSGCVKVTADRCDGGCEEGSVCRVSPVMTDVFPPEPTRFECVPDPNAPPVDPTFPPQPDCQGKCEFNEVCEFQEEESVCVTITDDRCGRRCPAGYSCQVDPIIILIFPPPPPSFSCQPDPINPPNKCGIECPKGQECRQSPLAESGIPEYTCQDIENKCPRECIAPEVCIVTEQTDTVPPEDVYDCAVINCVQAPCP